MARHKTAELEGALLDAAVAKAAGVAVSFWGDQPILEGGAGMPGSNVTTWAPSRDWSQGGPIVERDRIAIEPVLPPDQWNEWGDAPPRNFGWKARRKGVEAVGEEPLLAAMRAYVASKFGEEVDLP